MFECGFAGPGFQEPRSATGVNLNAGGIGRCVGERRSPKISFLDGICLDKRTNCWGGGGGLDPFSLQRLQVLGAKTPTFPSFAFYSFIASRVCPPTTKFQIKWVSCRQ